MSSTDFSIAIGANISDFQAGMVGVRNSVSNTVSNINAQFNQFNTTIGKIKNSYVEAFAYSKTAWDGIKSAVGFTRDRRACHQKTLVGMKNAAERIIKNSARKARRR